MAAVIYICNEKQSNKFWSYEIKPGNAVEVKYGRVGEPGQTENYDFGSTAEMQKFIDKKVKEKTGPRKGYKLASQEKLKEETETAHEIGTRNKIKQITWVSRKGDVLKKLDQYDPKQFVFVEVLNSWSKEVTRLLLSKTSTWIIDGGITEVGREIGINTVREITGSHPFADAVRKLLKKTAEVVAEALKTVKVGAMGKRSLFDDETSEPSPEVTSALAMLEISGCEAGVVRKIAAMGARMLDL